MPWTIVFRALVLQKQLLFGLWGRRGRKQASLSFFITARPQTAAADLVGLDFLSPTSGVTIFLAELHILLLTGGRIV